MTRYVLCERCKKSLARTAELDDVVSAGEQVNFVGGTAKDDFVCDFCNDGLSRGSYCYAATLTTPEQRPYKTWESEYVEPGEQYG